MLLLPYLYPKVVILARILPLPSNDVLITSFWVKDYPKRPKINFNGSGQNHVMPCGHDHKPIRTGESPKGKLKGNFG